MKRRELERYERELGFVPLPAVRWLDPPELARTAAKAGLAKVFADYGDKREVQAVLPGGPVVLPRSASGQLWFDFTADTGDGFDATFSVATLLAQPVLELTPPGSENSLTLPRGDLLVLGGDEVYPAASARAYENRTIGPFGAALPYVKGERGPSLLAVPGNHDWYDGLTSFLRVFAQRSHMGAWQSLQTRSYFVAQLAPGWWLVGLDSQLGEYIDEPQLQYFRDNLSAHLQPGDGVIVCTASPAWVHTATKGPDGFNQLHYFDKTIVRTRKVPGTGGADRDDDEETFAAVRVWLTGDLHHYSRYTEVGHGGIADDPRSVQAITCGLGGAYLAETHDLPETLELPPAESRMRSKQVPGMNMRREGPVYPDAPASRHFFRRVANPFSRWWLGWRNPGFLVGMGWLQLAIFTAVGGILDLVQPEQGILAILVTPVARAAVVLGIVLLVTTVVLGVHALVAMLFKVGGIVVTLGIACQIATACLTWFILILLPIPTKSPAALLALTIPIAWALGALLGTQAFSLFLLTQGKGTVAHWRMSAQAIDSHKGFLRMTITASGDLIIHPIVIDTVTKDRDVEPNPAGGVTAGPVGGAPVARLLEAPIVVSRKGFGT